MKPNNTFLRQQKHFWANVRSISQQLGYTARGTDQIKTPAPGEVRAALEAIDLAADHLLNADNIPTYLGRTLFAYFKYRADILNNDVRPLLMDVRQAKALFEDLHASLYEKLKLSCPLPMNKQKGEKRTRAYLTCIVNMLIAANSGGLPCDYNPGQLTTVTRGGAPLRTPARRVDGAFPRTVDPIAFWEIKEYYYTTTFGSRVADGVYETLLDGMEREELREHEGVEVKHYLIIDDRNTWWGGGRSYLCRIIDMLHMGYVDEVLFGREMVEALRAIVQGWCEIYRRRVAFIIDS